MSFTDDPYVRFYRGRNRELSVERRQKFVPLATALFQAADKLSPEDALAEAVKLWHDVRHSLARSKSHSPKPNRRKFYQSYN